MRTLLRAITAVVVGGMVIAGSASMAGADPKGMPVVIHCGDMHFTATTAGNGEFTPAHDTGSNRVLVPLVFGDFTGTLTHVASGAVQVISETEQLVKGNSHPRGRTILECTYTFTDRFIAGPDDEGLTPGHEYVFVGVGEVTGFASGRR